MEFLNTTLKAMFISDWLLISFLIFISGIIILDSCIKFTFRYSKYLHSEDILLLIVIAIWSLFIILEPIHNALTHWGSIRHYHSYSLSEAYGFVFKAVSLLWLLGAAISAIINPFISNGNKLIKLKWFFYGLIMNIPSIYWLLKQQQETPNNKINADQKPVV